MSGDSLHSLSCCAYCQQFNTLIRTSDNTLYCRNCHQSCIHSKIKPGLCTSQSCSQKLVLKDQEEDQEYNIQLPSTRVQDHPVATTEAKFTQPKFTHATDTDVKKNRRNMCWKYNIVKKL